MFAVQVQSMHGDTASLYNPSDCQEPVQIAAVKRERLNSREKGQCKKNLIIKNKGKKKTKKTLNKTREVKRSETQTRNSFNLAK